MIENLGQFLLVVCLQWLPIVGALLLAIHWIAGAVQQSAD